MNIRDLMDEQHRGEEIREGKVGIRKLLLPVSILVLAALEVALCMGLIRDGVSIMGFLAGLVVFIYLFYAGVSAWVVSYVRKKGSPDLSERKSVPFCVSLHPKSAPCSLPWGL